MGLEMYADHDVDDVDVEELLEKFRTVKERVEYILSRYPQTRNNDMYLWIMYVRTFVPELSKYIKFIPYEVFEKATPIETVTRARRKIQEEGRYLPTDPEVLRKRRKLAEVYRRAMPQA